MTDISPEGIKYNWASGENGWGEGMNLNLEKLTSWQRGLVNVKDPAYNAAGNGTTDDYAALLAAEAASVLVDGTLVFPPGTYLVGTNLTITSAVVFLNGATLEPDAGVTVTLDKVTTAPGASIIASTALGTVSITGAVNGSGVLDVRTFGAVGGATDDTTAFTRACTSAAASGINRVLIPFDTFTVTGPADASGCAIVGNGRTAVSGYFENASTVEGLKLGGVQQDYEARHPTIPFDRVMKAIQYIDANRFYAYVENPTRGYSLIVFQNNITITQNSLATSNSDPTQYRVVQMLDCVEVLTGYRTASAESGTWGSDPVVGGIPAYNSGTLYRYNRSTSTGAWREYTITVPEDGFFSVGFARTATASTDVDVLVDGVVVEADLDISNATADLMVRRYTALPGVRVIRVENNDVAGTALNIAGINFARLRDQRSDVTLDTLGYFRDTTSYISPIDANSANDYAILNDDTNIYGGSYHGGESGFTLALLIDGVATTLSSGFRIARSIEFIQSSTITWTGGAPVVNSGTRHVIHQGGYSIVITLDGDITAKEYYTTLIGLNENYTHIAAPILLPFSAIADDERYPIGQTGAVEYRSATTGQRIRITHTTYSQPENRYGGAYIWKVVGRYLKYYNPWIRAGQRVVSSLSSVVTVQAS